MDSTARMHGLSRCVQGRDPHAASVWMEKSWPVLERELRKAGWSLKGASLCPSPWRAAWGSQLPSHSHMD